MVVSVLKTGGSLTGLAVTETDPEACADSLADCCSGRNSGCYPYENESIHANLIKYRYILID